MVIYVDMLLALNGWVDFLLLLGVRRLSGGGGKAWRLALGALLGAVFGLALLLPTMPLLAMLGLKLSAAILMVLLAFPWNGGRVLVRRVVLLFGLSTGLAGLCGALYFFVAPTGFYVANGVVYYSVPPLLLVGLTLLCYGLMWLMERWTQRRAPRNHWIRVRLTVGENRVEFSCLYDSGNHLAEPFSGAPVLLLERETATKLLAVPDLSKGEEPAPGWRLIPYHSIGGAGVLPAFAPDEAVAIIGNGAYPLGRCYVAVCPRLGRGEYVGLIGSKMGEILRRRGGKSKCFTD